MQTWTNQFEKPTSKALTAELDAEVHESYTHFKQAVVDIVRTKPKLEWTGLAWKWAEAIKLDTQGLLQSIYLVPDPDTLRVAVSISTAFFDAHPPSSFPSPLAEGLSSATVIGHQTWCEWALDGQEANDAILHIIQLAYDSKS